VKDKEQRRALKMQRKSDYEVGGKEEHDKKTTQG
jgi:hypothetical protein